MHGDITLLQAMLITYAVIPFIVLVGRITMDRTVATGAFLALELIAELHRLLRSA
jgi:hypothetical protein